ncbi:hypothetical protein BY996DRAFT_6584883 [Phakopsora pachyrhizi]|nr:hypothetical protein BY996DRAFT_6584883 [Phakopsora pachyrhizi]
MKLQSELGDNGRQTRVGGGKAAPEDRAAGAEWPVAVLEMQEEQEGEKMDLGLEPKT